MVLLASETVVEEKGREGEERMRESKSYTKKS